MLPMLHRRNCSAVRFRPVRPAVIGKRLILLPVLHKTVYMTTPHLRRHYVERLQRLPFPRQTAPSALKQHFVQVVSKPVLKDNI
jgi:hypothetical protein